MTFGEKLKDARTKADMTQTQLAERLNVSRQAISKWEADKGMPDIENLKLISKTLQVSIDYLLDDVTDVDLAYAVNNIDKTFYLVYQDGKRYLVLITDEYFESRQLPDSVKMKKKWFRVGRFEFRDQGLLK